MKKEKRFVKVLEESLGLSYTVSIIADKETGVHYLLSQNGYSGGLTPLLKADGTPVVLPVSDQ